MAPETIYLDHAATTATDPQVVAAMLPYFSAGYGNPSSIYRLGRASLEALDDARETVAMLLGAKRKEIVFTSGGSEANNLAIKGVAFAQREAGRGNHIITSAIEHHAVLHAVEYLEHFGFEITVLPVDATGLVHVDDLRAALRPTTVLASIMAANNEIGTLQPIAELGAVCHEHDVLFHTDAVQMIGALPVNVKDLQVDLLSLSAHKFHGPKGVGALYIRRGVPLLPQINGGSQERRLRAGTENVPGIVGLSTALQIAVEGMAATSSHCAMLRDRLITGVMKRVDHVHLNGHRTARLPNNVNLSFDFIEGESMLLLLDQQGIYASSGSACTSGSLDPSHVLMALGLSPERAHGSLRLSVGRENTIEQIERVLDLLPPIVERLRSVSPMYRQHIQTVGVSV